MTGEVFKPQIGRNIQAYVDDLIVKSSNRQAMSATWRKLSPT
jgi:hypothetical protein